MNNEISVQCEVVKTTPTVNALIAELHKVSDLIEDLSKVKASITADLKRFVELPTRANAKIELANGNGIVVATLTTVQTVSLDSASVKELHPEIYAECSKIGFRSTVKLV